MRQGAATATGAAARAGARRAAVVALVLATLVAPAGADGGYRLPVEGEVVAAFRPPADPYGPGHRGVDLRARPGAVVVAAAAGRVGFAGAVAEARWVTLVHPDGVRTSYGELAGVVVAVGQQLGAGEPLGRVGAAHGDGGLVHWSARRDGTYVDPLALLAGRLVPSLVGSGGWTAGDVPAIPRYDPWDGRQRLGLVPRSPRAQGPGYVLPPNPNQVIAIAGLGSRTGEPPLDLTHLGYAAADVTELSYAGPDGRGRQTAYGPGDTWGGVHAAALTLREELRAQWARAPGRAVDLVGHSLGGVVAMHYLLNLHDPADPTLPPVAHVATVAAPLEGADLAGAVVDLADDPHGVAVLTALGALAADHDALNRSVADLAPGSDVVAGLAAAWELARADLAAGPLATGTRVLTLGGEGDLVVPEHRSDLPGADHAVLPGGHDRVRETEAVRIVLHEFLADAPVPGEAGGLGHLVSHPLGWVERSLPVWLLPG
jgi:murein DD-endopeptidase MepM/ murein hydrolase activator NlpD